ATMPFFSAFLLAAVLMGISQIPLAFMLARTLQLLPFVLLAGLAVPWSSDRGFQWFAALIMRSLLCLILLVLLTNTTRFSELLRGLRKLGFPRILAMNLGFLYRYLFVLTDEAMRMNLARECRMVGRLPVRRHISILSSMLGTLLLRSFERAEQTYKAMLSRGHTLDAPVLAPRRFGLLDVAFLALAAGYFYLIMRWRT
ncbi:MAG: CbiQ family ECF transporter T component, partial [Acidobacteriota bacterium]